MRKKSIFIILILFLVGCSSKKEEKETVVLCTRPTFISYRDDEDSSYPIFYNNTLLIRSVDNEISYLQRIQNGYSDKITEGMPLMAITGSEPISHENVDDLVKELNKKEGITLKLYNLTEETDYYIYYYEHDYKKNPFDELSEDEKTIIGYTKESHLTGKYASRQIDLFLSQDSRAYCQEINE